MRWPTLPSLPRTILVLRLWVCVPSNPSVLGNLGWSGPPRGKGTWTRLVNLRAQYTQITWGTKDDETLPAGGWRAAESTGANRPPPGLGPPFKRQPEATDRLSLGFHWPIVMRFPVHNSGPKWRLLCSLPPASLPWPLIPLSLPLHPLLGIIPQTAAPACWLLSWAQPPGTSTSGRAGLSGRDQEDLPVRLQHVKNFHGQVSNQYTDSQLLFYRFSTLFCIIKV